MFFYCLFISVATGDVDNKRDGLVSQYLVYPSHIFLPVSTLKPGPSFPTVSVFVNH